MNLDEILEDLKILIKKAGEEVLKYYDQEFETEKKDDSPVTAADLASEKIILDGLKKYSGFGMISEENKEDKSHIGKEMVFVTDPLDGTKDFIHKTGDFSILLALLKNNQPIIGLIYKPLEKKLYFASKGKGAFIEIENKKEKIEASKVQDFLKIRILMSMFHLGETEKSLAEKYSWQYKRVGSAGLKLAALAEGQAEVYISSSSRTGEWDVAAGKIILEEAGGKITDINGNELEFNKQTPFNTNGFVGSNKINHNQIIKALKEAGNKNI